MFEFIFKKILPFALARTMSLAAIPFFQFALMAFSSKAEAGKFFFISNAAFVISQIADMGMSRAFPVIFGGKHGTANKYLPEIMSSRIILSLIGGALFFVFNRFGEIKWSWNGAGLSACFFCVGRVVLLGCQGYRHSHQHYGKLLKGSVVHIIFVTVFLLTGALYKEFNSNLALAALAIGVWVEAFFIGSSKAYPVFASNDKYLQMFKKCWPFMAFGVTNSIYVRIDSIVAGRLFSPELLGIYGTLDSALKMCIWPSYVGAQAVYPAVNDAVKNRDEKAFALASGRFFKLGLVICLVAMTISAIFWYSNFNQDANWNYAALFLWVSIWMALPNAFMNPLYYSFKLEADLTVIMFKLATIRVLSSIILAIYFRVAGLCANHTVITFFAMIMLYNQLKARKPDWIGSSTS
jgi:O-antigen/teichoic acid export membrane protein